jgi:2-polyprenyl-6-methoxyphenol hydroxylase-like FAD-dependent oxidoreductase
MFKATVDQTAMESALSLRTQIAIIEAGPPGLLLGQGLDRAGSDNVVLYRTAARMTRARALPLAFAAVE